MKMEQAQQPRPYWMVAKELRDAEHAIQPMVALPSDKDRYLRQVADAAFDDESTGDFWMAANTYDDVAHRLPLLADQVASLKLEKSKNSPTSVYCRKYRRISTSRMHENID